jgi:molybdate transport system substrate-binding protein
MTAPDAEHPASPRAPDAASDREPLRLLSAGAGQGLVETLEQEFLRAEGARLQCRFGAVGAMKAALLEGAPCDVMVLTTAMIRALQASGELRPGSEAVLGEVETGIAVRANEPLPDVSTPQALRQALLSAAEIYFPDPQRATAGIHFASVLAQLGIAAQVEARLRTFPNGMTAMRELVLRAPPTSIGCTQITEIRYTPGVAYAGGLPAGCELKTHYAAAVATRATQPEPAQRFIAFLTGPQAEATRARLGFGGKVA